MKRFLSILLACMMLLSMVTISHAADAVSVEYWNADSTKITIDLTSEVDAEVLKAATVVTQNGKPVDFTVTKKVKVVNTSEAPETVTDFGSSKNQTLEFSAMIPTTTTTYEIRPANGLNFTDVFGVAIGADITGTAWSKTFMVRKLWIENFDSYTIADGARQGTGAATNLPWLYRTGYSETALNNNNIGLEDDGTGNKAMFWKNGGASSVFTVMPSHKDGQPNLTVNFADTGVPASTYWASGSAARKKNNYNIELDMRYYTDASDAHYARGFRIAMQNLAHQQNIYGGAGIIAGFGVQQLHSFQMLAGTWGQGGYTSGKVASFQVNTNTNTNNVFYTNYFEKGAPYVTYSADPENRTMTWDNSPLKKSTLDKETGLWKSGHTHKVSMSVLNGNLKYSLDDAFINYDFDPYTGTGNRGQLGIFAFNAYVSSQNHTYYVDNIVVSQVEEVTVASLAASDFLATKEMIKFNLDKDIPAENIAEGITLQKNGVAVTDYTVEKVADKQYAIIPAAGVALGATYTVDIAAGYYNDATGAPNSLAVAVTQNVAVEVANVTAPTYINANSTKIMIDLAEDVDADALKDLITLANITTGEVEFTVEKRVKTVNTTGTANSDKANKITPLDITEEFTYDIIPVGGIELGSAYNLSIYTTSGVWSKNFKVNKLWIEDFDGYEIDDETGAYAFPWKLARGSNENSYLKLTDDGTGNKVMYLQHQSSVDYAVMPSYIAATDEKAGDPYYDVNFADTGVPSYEYWAKNSEAIKKTEYNIELDMAFNTAFSDAIYGHGFKIHMRYPYAPNDQTIYGSNGIVAGVAGGKKLNDLYHHTMLAATYGYGEYTYSKVGSAQVNGFSDTSADKGPNYWYEDFYGAPYVSAADKSGTTWSHTLLKKSSGINSEPINMSKATVHKVAMSVKDNNLKFSFDKGFENYDFDPFNPENTAVVNHNGFVTFNGAGNGGQPQKYVIDNIVVTEFEELTEEVITGDLVVTVAGEKVENLDGATSIDAVINVANIGDELPCSVVLAIYNSSNKSLKNAVVSDITCIEKGITPFTFKNVEVKEGDVLEIFFWDGFVDLKPYRAPVTFPDAE